MPQNVLPCDRDQELLLPPSLPSPKLQPRPGPKSSKRMTSSGDLGAGLAFQEQSVIGVLPEWVASV